jgi:protein phosphatase
MLMANRAIFQSSLEVTSRQGMGTTVVGLRFTGDTVSVCHAGDSRAYLLRGGRIAQITPDHSLSNFLFALGRDAEARLAASTMSNVIMRALGLESDVEVESQELTVQPGDRFLLCSDGLSDLVSDSQLEFYLSDAHLSLEDMSDRLVERALQAGGRDNITVLIVEVALASQADIIVATTESASDNDRDGWDEPTSPGSRRMLMDTDPNDLTPVPTDE